MSLFASWSRSQNLGPSPNVREFALLPCGSPLREPNSHLPHERRW